MAMPFKTRASELATDDLMDWGAKLTAEGSFDAIPVDILAHDIKYLETR